MANTQLKLDYKQTSIGRIPKEWKVVSFKDAGKTVNGFGFPTKYQGKKDAKYIFVKVSDTNLAGNDKYIFAAKNTIGDNIVKKLKIQIYPTGTIIFPKIGMVIFLRKVRILRRPGTFDNNIMGIIPDEDVANREFLYYYFLEKLDLVKLAGMTTAPSVRKTEVEKLQISLPPLPEQQKIAEILFAIDEAIQKVDEAIGKTQRVKKGLMEKLLTKGIGHREFKDSEIGRIPNGWEAVSLGESVDIELIMGQSPPSSSYNEENQGLPFLQGKAEFGDVYPVVAKYTTQPLKIAEEADVLISVRAPVGDVNLAPFKLCIGRGLSAIRVKKGNNLFYFYWFQKMKKVMENVGTGSIFKAITRNELENFRVAVPPVDEQQKIAEILSAVDKKIELEKKRKGMLQKIKKGLMEDLLTGNKRVKV